MSLRKISVNEVILASNGKLYSLHRLYKVAKDQHIVRFRENLNSRDELQDVIHGTMTYAMFAHHMLEVEKSDLRIPVIIDPNNRIIHGRMHLIKGIFKGKDEVYAIKFETWAEMDDALAEKVSDRMAKSKPKSTWWFAQPPVSAKSKKKITTDS